MLVGGGGGSAGNGFQVVMSDLVDAAATFKSEAATFKAIMPDNGPPCPDGGGAFDQNLSVVVQMIGTLHLQAAGVMEDDSAKLTKAHANYANTDESLAQLCNQIISPSKIN